ncbi:P-loop containing nucleoside triphosphate hydrolase protein [Trametes cingulata]|nr:P-loop containing nucleoside triphosphate hydrolase protein [Trametes cingulata]
MSRFDTVQHPSFCSPEGQHFVTDIIQPALHYEPHNYQLDGICKSLDGIDLLAILATGSGKTAYFTMDMLVLQALSKKPRTAQWGGAVPYNPAMIVVYPTVGLETKMARTFETAGLPSVIINHDTAGAAHLEGRNLWEGVVTKSAMILLSPEMLSSDSFESLLQKRKFSSRLCALGVDEVHLCNSWGESFCPCFRQIGLAQRCMPTSTDLILVTATLAAGLLTMNIINSFGLCPREYHLIRRSNLRPDVRVIIRTLTCGPAGPAYPDFRWVLSSTRKMIIFCPTIVHGQHLTFDLRTHVPSSVDPFGLIRTYNALKWSDFNEVTLELFRKHDTDTMIIVATDTLMVGVDLPNVEDVILATTPDMVDEMVQKIGRAGRDPGRIKDARGIAQKQASGEVKESPNIAGSHGPLEEVMALMIAADCKMAAQNSIYGNPETDSPCPCPSCH